MKKLLSHSGKQDRYSRRNFVRGLFIAPSLALSVAEIEARPSQNIGMPSTVNSAEPDFKQYVTKQLNTLVDLTGDSGAIQQQIVQLRRTMVDIQNQLDQCNQQIGTCESIATAQETLNQIKRALGI
jgi:hypothetical protein